MNTDNNTETIKIPSQDVQDRRHALLSSTPVLSEQQPQKKKKRSHGNRKEQHKRRRLRRQQHRMNNNRNPTNQNIINMTNENHHPNREQTGQEQIQNYPQNIQHQSKSKNKRKYQDLNQNTTHVNRSLSALSIAQENPKKKKKITTTIATATATAITTETNNPSVNELSTVMTDDNQQEREIEEEEEEEEEEENSISLPTNSIPKFKPQYLKVSDRIFKRMLLNAIQDGDKTVQCLDTKEKLQFVRHMMEVSNNLYYFDLQGDLWQAYFNIGIKENIWTTESTNSNVNQSNEYQIYFFPRQLVEQRQKTITHQKQRTINELQQCLIDLQRNIEQWQPSIDFERLKQIVTECVKKSQHRLKQQFIYKAEIAELDLHDRQAMTKFYNLQPNQEQISLTNQYWQIVANEQRTTEEIETLRKRIYLKRIPSKINRIIDQSMDHIQPMLHNSALDKDRRASLVSNYSKTITQYKVDLMSLNLNTLENIRRGHQQKLLDLKEIISQSCNDSLKQAIENRQQTMEKRHKKYLDYTLNTFFDEAPMTINE